MEKQNVRLTTGVFAVYPRDDCSFSFLAADQCTDAYFCKPAHGGAAEQSGAGEDGTPTGRFVQETTDPRGRALLDPRVSKTTIPTVSSQARTNEILCKPMEGQNVRLRTGFSAGRRPLFVSACLFDLCTDAYLSL